MSDARVKHIRYWDTLMAINKSYGHIVAVRNEYEDEAEFKACWANDEIIEVRITEREP